MTREITHRYVDPLDAVWTASAARMGFRIVRSPDVFASTDGRGSLLIGTPDTLDADDCLAQMVFHELCHALIQGPDGLACEDWGLDNQSEADLWREHACLRLQAQLLRPHGLRWVLAPTTDHRAFYDSLGVDPLEGASAEETMAVHKALAWADRHPWAPHLERALEATQQVASAVLEASSWSSTPADRSDTPVLFSRLEPALPRHASGFPLAPSSRETCGTCAWGFSRGAAAMGCRHAGNAVVRSADRACERWEPQPDCQRCGACCREAYGEVRVSPDDPVVRLHRELLTAPESQPSDAELSLARSKGRCVALVGEGSQKTQFSCRIYDDRPRTCRDFERGGEHCLTARRRVGLSR